MALIFLNVLHLSKKFPPRYEKLVTIIMNGDLIILLELNLLVL